MIDYLGMVKEFHEKYNHHTQTKITVPPIEVLGLRFRLINEEAKEFNMASYELMNHPDRAEYLVEIADAIGDLLYVVFGAALAYGIPIEEVFTEIHRSNMTKSTLKNEFGKSIKGDYSPADIASILERNIGLK